MQYSLYLNQQKAIEWGLNASQAMLFAFLYELPSWADAVPLDGTVYCRISKSKVIEELPLLTDKPDTVYRLMCQLRDAGLIAMTAVGNQTMVAITLKGKAWNRDELSGSGKNPTPRAPSGPRRKIRPSEIDPEEVGEKSDPGSEKNPTYQITNNQITKSDSSLRSEVRAGRAAPHGTRLTLTDLPDDWATWASTEAGLPAQQLATTWLTFRDYWQAAAGAKGRKADWFATWRNWIRRDLENRRSNGTPPARPAGAIHRGINDQDWDAAKAQAFDNCKGIF